MSAVLNTITLIAWGFVCVTSDIWWVRLVALIICAMAACNIYHALENERG